MTAITRTWFERIVLGVETTRLDDLRALPKKAAKDAPTR